MLLFGFGFESGGLVVVYVIYNGLMVLFVMYKYWYGEKVVFGMLVMFMFIDRVFEFIEEVY